MNNIGTFCQVILCTFSTLQFFALNSSSGVFFFVSFSFDAFIMRFIFYAGHMVKCANEMLTKRGHSFATCLILSRFQFLLDAFHWMSLLVSAISSFYRLFFFFFFFFLHSFHLQKPKLAKSNSVINNVRCYLN